ncbi:hypothetical protein L1987_48742 [Smallanthus sonchifolius]|uniref:Uncharacterized protein n=1 Tax=Smallanthus sonchifolius TaxID=185202 RepID=A0ACB9FSL0_9ASTR|nr:hypothetical protein L1987_48742 [Smallanthus sonchifolius]
MVEEKLEPSTAKMMVKGSADCLNRIDHLNKTIKYTNELYCTMRVFRQMKQRFLRLTCLSMTVFIVPESTLSSKQRMTMDELGRDPMGPNRSRVRCGIH